MTPARRSPNPSTCVLCLFPRSGVDRALQLGVAPSTLLEHRTEPDLQLPGHVIHGDLVAHRKHLRKAGMSCAPAVRQYRTAAEALREHKDNRGVRGPGLAKGPDARRFGEKGHTVLQVRVALAANVEERLQALGVSATHALLRGIATLEREGSAKQVRERRAATGKTEGTPAWPKESWRKHG